MNCASGANPHVMALWFVKRFDGLCVPEYSLSDLPLPQARKMNTTGDSSGGILIPAGIIDNSIPFQDLFGACTLHPPDRIKAVNTPNLGTVS